MKKTILIIACASALVLTSCNKKAEEAEGPAKADNAVAEQPVPAEQAAPAEPAIPPDPAIDASALLGEWKQTVDDDPGLYIFMENGKCSAKDLMHETPVDCTYELLTPEKAQSRFNLLIIHFPAAGNEEAYDNRINIRISGDKLDFPSDDGEVSEYNKYKKVDPNAAPEKANNAEGTPETN